MFSGRTNTSRASCLEGYVAFARHGFRSPAHPAPAPIFCQGGRRRGAGGGAFSAPKKSWEVGRCVSRSDGDTWPRKTGEANGCPGELSWERQRQPRPAPRRGERGRRRPCSWPCSPRGLADEVHHPGSVPSPGVALEELLQTFLRGTVFSSQSPAVRGSPA